MLPINPKFTSFLSDLLPYSLDKRNLQNIPKALIEYQLFLKATFTMIQELKIGNYQVLDALVTENLCQIRALKISSTIRECLFSFQEKEQRIQHVIEEIDSYIEKDDRWFIDRGLSFNHLLQSRYVIPLTDNELYLVMSYLLFLVKDVFNPDNYFFRSERTNVKNLTKIMPKVSGEFCKKTVIHLRQKLAMASSYFIREISFQSPDPMDREMLSEERMIKYNGLYCLPFFRTTKVILEIGALLLRIPIVFWVQHIDGHRNCIREIAAYYEPRDKYYSKKPGLDDLVHPVIVVRGVTSRRLVSSMSELGSFMSKIDPIAVINACSAHHRQYPDETCTIEDDPLLNEYKVAATQYGCTRKNTSLFTTMHMYCDHLKNIAPLKYVINEHLKKYEDFYKSQWFKLFQSTWAIADLNHELYFDGSTIKMTLTPHWSLDEIYRLFPDDSFMIDPVVVYIGNDNWEIRLNMNLSGSGFHNPSSFFYRSSFVLIRYAKEYIDPTEFILDHRAFWPDQDSIIDFLYSIQKNVESLVMLDLLFELMKEGFCSETCIEALKKAYSCTDLKIKIKGYLFDNFSFLPLPITTYVCVNMISDFEIEERKIFFQKIVEQHPLSLIIYTKNYLDGDSECELFYSIMMERLEMVTRTQWNPNMLPLFRYKKLLRNPYKFSSFDDGTYVEFMTYTLRCLLDITIGHEKFTENVRLFALRYLLSALLRESENQFPKYLHVHFTNILEEFKRLSRDHSQRILSELEQLNAFLEEDSQKYYSSERYENTEEAVYMISVLNGMLHGSRMLFLTRISPEESYGAACRYWQFLQWVPQKNPPPPQITPPSSYQNTASSSQKNQRDDKRIRHRRSSF